MKHASDIAVNLAKRLGGCGGQLLLNTKATHPSALSPVVTRFRRFIVCFMKLSS